MKINCGYLKKFIDIENVKIIPYQTSRSEKRNIWKELFASIGLETAEIIDYKGTEVFDIEITPNRPDWLSHVGVARDLHSKLNGIEFHNVEAVSREFPPNREKFAINIENPGDCGRYIGCIINNVEVKDSSQEIKELLESLGLRPINNLVDISNLIVMTIGHPIHMFDLDQLKGNEINIRRARKGEQIMLLDGQQIKLDGDFLVIADQSDPVALAGIMGGEYSGVTAKTSNILIESAYFSPSVIRKAARKIGIKSDASFRFERGADILIPPTAINMALDMIEESVGCSPDVTYCDDQFPAVYNPMVIRLNKNFPSEYSGIHIEDNAICQILTDLGFGLEDNGDYWDVTVPSFRSANIYGKQDLAEEVIRIHGYDRLKSEIPKTINPIVKAEPIREMKHKMAQHLISIGFFEVMNYIFMNPEEQVFFGLSHDFLEIKNPLGKDFSILRQSLYPGLLKNLQLNFNQSLPGAGLFEYGNRFWIDKGEIQEKEIMAVCASGEYWKRNWSNNPGQGFDFFVFKSLIFSLFSKLKIPVTMKNCSRKYFDDGSSFMILSGEKELGEMGIVNKAILDWYQLEKKVMLAEFGISEINKQLATRSFQMWNIYPSSSRDFSFLMDKSLKYSQLESAIQEFKPDSLDDYTLFDRYQGKGIPEGKIGLSMSFSYSNNKRTLKNEEINEMHTHFINQLIKKFDLIQR